MRYTRLPHESVPRSQSTNVTYHRSQPTRLGSPSVAETSPALNTPHVPQPLILSVLLSLFLKYLNLLPPELSEIPSVLKNAAQLLPSPSRLPESLQLELISSCLVFKSSSAVGFIIPCLVTRLPVDGLIFPTGAKFLEVRSLASVILFPSRRTLHTLAAQGLLVNRI